MSQGRKYQATDSEIRAGYCLPPRFIPSPQISGITVRFIVSEYAPLFELVFFRPMQTLMRIVRERFVSQVISSALIHWSSYIGAQMIRTLRQDGEQANIQQFLPWLDRLDRIATESNNDVSLDDLTRRLCGALELMFLKHITADVKTGYTLLRRMAPLLMQVASADPMLWPRDPASNGISLAHALACGQYEIGRFIFVDMIASLMSGLPPLVEYDTSHPVIHTHGGYPMEHIHGCPTQFAFSIVRINQWRARHLHGGSEEDIAWKAIEKEVWAWRSSCDNGPDAESLRLVMRLALQEAWRHALLIYLYMGMCGVTSHDSRVQSSVQQISDLHTVIKSQIAAGMHLLVPLLLAGVCTRSEADRNKFRAVVSQTGTHKTWLLKSMRFTSLLDHLWHGVAVNGGPVTWDDYVRSRRAVVDMGV